MYTLLRENPGAPAGTTSTALGRGWRLPRVSRNVLFLGLTSLFTDISSEMVSSVLPLYFLLHLNLTPLGFGVIDGLYQGSAALVRVASGLTADRWRRHKEVAAFGYALSAVCKLGLLAAGGAWGVLTSVILLDRMGKGVRSAPRDALISLSSPRESLGAAFGVHRALDTAGALVGPLVAFGLLMLAPGAFDAIFVVSFCVALIGLAMLVLFVENRPVAPVSDSRAGAEPDAEPPSLRSVAGLLVAPRFLVLVIVGGMLGLVTVSDGFLYLVLQRRLDFNIGFFPLLYVATALVYLVLAVPAGWLADRIGRGRVFVSGYALLIGVYAVVLQPSLGMAGVIASVLLFGAYYAATDGILMALASAVLPANLRTSGLALLTTVTGVARLLGSLFFGALWTWRGAEAAVTVFLAGVVAGVIVAAAAFMRGARSDQRNRAMTAP